MSKKSPESGRNSHRSQAAPSEGIDEMTAAIIDTSVHFKKSCSPQNHLPRRKKTKTKKLSTVQSAGSVHSQSLQQTREVNGKAGEKHKLGIFTH